MKILQFLNQDYDQNISNGKLEFKICCKYLITGLLEKSFEQKHVNAAISCVPAQYRDEATTCDSNSKSTLLDLILTHHEDYVRKIDYMSPLGMSERVVLVFDQHISVNQDMSAQARINIWEVNKQETVLLALLIDETTGLELRNLYIKVYEVYILRTIPISSRNSPW